MEIFDVVDEKGIPTGETVERTEAHALGIRHRTSHIWLMRKENGKTEILLQKRATNKDSYPGFYDTSAAGHIGAGDEPLNGALRELNEELGIKATADDLTYVGYFHIYVENEFYGKAFKDNQVSFTYVYEKPVDEKKLVLQEDEVESVKWFDFDYLYEECREINDRFCVSFEDLVLIKNYLDSKVD